MSILSTYITYDQASREYTLVDILNAARAILTDNICMFQKDTSELYAALEELKGNLIEYPPSVDRVYWMQRLQQIVAMVDKLHPDLLPVRILVHKSPSDLEKLALASINKAAETEFVTYNLLSI